MTTEQMDIDYLLAEKFGFTDITYTGIRLNGSKEYTCIVNGKRIHWCPSVLIENALGDGGPGTVVGEMRKRGYWLMFDTGPYYAATFYPKYTTSPKVAAATDDKTPARAICLAACEWLRNREVMASLEE